MYIYQGRVVGVKAEAAETFCSEPNSEPEPGHFPAAGVGARVDTFPWKCEPSERFARGLIRSRVTSPEAGAANNFRDSVSLLYR